jgi:hypothetical protein
LRRHPATVLSARCSGPQTRGRTTAEKAEQVDGAEQLAVQVADVLLARRSGRDTNAVGRVRLLDDVASEQILTGCVHDVRGVRARSCVLVHPTARTALGLYAIGRYMLPHADGAPKTNQVSHLGFDLLRSLIVSQALTQGIKYAARPDRPTGECCAFPSGHSSATFATASVLERHLGYRGAWPTFAIAAYVATSRSHDSRHFLSDVVFGHGKSNFALMSEPVKGGVVVTLTRKPSSQAVR